MGSCAWLLLLVPFTVSLPVNSKYAPEGWRAAPNLRPAPWQEGQPCLGTGPVEERSGENLEVLLAEGECPFLAAFFSASLPLAQTKGLADTEQQIASAFPSLVYFRSRQPPTPPAMLSPARGKGKRQADGTPHRSPSTTFGRLRRALSRGELSRSRSFSRSGSFSSVAGRGAKAEAPASKILLTGLRELRAEGLLCDVALGAGGGRFAAHQAVLAAASDPLRRLFAEGAEASGATLSTPPRPMELQLEGLDRPGLVEALLDHIYQRDSSAAAGADPDGLRELSAALKLPGLEPGSDPSDSRMASEALARSLRGLRSGGCLCDFVFLAAGERVPAHQVVLAASSLPLCAYILQGLKERGPEAAQPPQGSDGAAPPKPPNGDGSPAAPTAGKDGAPGPSVELNSEPMELELQGISHADALYTVLNHVYGAADAAMRFRPLTEEAQWDVLRLATAFELPALREHAARWLREGANDSNTAGRLAVCDELGLTALRAEILRQAGAPPSPGGAPSSSSGVGRQAGIPPSPGGAPSSSSGVARLPWPAATLAAPAASPAAPAPASAACVATPEGSKDELKWLLKQAEPGEPVAAAAPPAPPVMKSRSGKRRPKGEAVPPRVPSTTPKSRSGRRKPKAILVPAEMSDVDLSSCMMCIPMARFDDNSVPCRAARGGAAAPAQPRQDEKMLNRLSELFEQRPMWLQSALEYRLSKSVDVDELLRPLSVVAYQFSDGPWQAAFVKLGWDPRNRRNAEEAKWLQVFHFRDPAFRQRGGRRRSAASPASAAAADHNFRQPPTQRTQLYQFCDIKDEYIKELVRGSKPRGACNRRHGWLDPLVYEATHARLAVRSQKMRERSEALPASGRGAAQRGRGASRGEPMKSRSGRRRPKESSGPGPGAEGAEGPPMKSRSGRRRPGSTRSSGTQTSGARTSGARTSGVRTSGARRASGARRTSDAQGTSDARRASGARRTSGVRTSGVRTSGVRWSGRSGSRRSGVRKRKRPEEDGALEG